MITNLVYISDYAIRIEQEGEDAMLQAIYGCELDVGCGCAACEMDRQLATVSEYDIADMDARADVGEWLYLRDQAGTEEGLSATLDRFATQRNGNDDNTAPLAAA